MKDCPIEARLRQLGHELPATPAAVGSYVPVVKFGDLVVTSGQLPFVGKELTFQGKVGGNLTEEEGGHAARLCLLNALAQVKSAIGSLDRVKQVARLEGYVKSAPGFTNQPLVLNPASNLLTEIFGEAGRHTRIAIGANELPLNAAVELALWIEVTPD